MFNPSKIPLPLVLCSLLILSFESHSQVKANIRGEYARNTAQGWHRYTEADGTEVEVIPELPRMEYLYIGFFRRFTHQYGEGENSFCQKGKYRITNDTLELIYRGTLDYGKGWFRRVKSSKKYFYNDACMLVSRNPNEHSFYRKESCY